MKKKKGRVGFFFIGFLMFAILSASITFFVVEERQARKDKLEEKLAAGIVKDEVKIATPVNLKELFSNLDEIWLESNPGAAESIEIDGEDLQEISNFFETLAVEKTLEEDEKEPFLYIIHMKSKNAKIHVLPHQLLIEDLQGTDQIFKVDEKKLEELISLLDHIYMNRYNASVTFKKADVIQVEARDANKKWMLNDQEIKEFLDKVDLLAPIHKEKAIGIPTSYPDYHISITSREKKYAINLLNREVLTLDSSDNFAYYQYDPTLWQYIEERLPVKSASEKGEIGYLLKAKSVVVDDLLNEYDFEDTTYYPAEIPRYILKSSLEPVKELPEDEMGAFKMTFIVGKEPLTLDVYQNHVVYQGKVYLSSKIAESVRSIFSTP